MNTLVVKEITKRYTRHTALDNVSMTIPERCIHGLLGPNGAGKTTLIRIINQIINADKGTIFIQGQKLAPHHTNVIGYLPEERGLYKKLKVGEQLIYLAQLRGLSKRVAKSRVKYWTDKFEIGNWWNKKIEDLSKGMAQKVQFISTVLHEPSLLILDEPFSGFDPINANLIRDEIIALKERGCTIIFSTHRMETVEDICDSITLIHKSKKIIEGTKDQVKSSFKTNAYEVECKGELSLDRDRYEILHQKITESDYTKAVIKIKGNTGANQLIQELINSVEVRQFQEKIPTMNDIFIQLTNGKSDA